jgi:hypothetical protein
MKKKKKTSCSKAENDPTRAKSNRGKGYFDDIPSMLSMNANQAIRLKGEAVVALIFIPSQKHCHGYKTRTISCFLMKLESWLRIFSVFETQMGGRLYSKTLDMEICPC